MKHGVNPSSRGGNCKRIESEFMSRWSTTRTILARDSRYIHNAVRPRATRTECTRGRSRCADSLCCPTSRQLQLPRPCYPDSSSPSPYSPFRTRSPPISSSSHPDSSSSPLKRESSASSWPHGPDHQLPQTSSPASYNLSSYVSSHPLHPQQLQPTSSSTHSGSWWD
jgi:hypothetical protein